jgi:aerobic-type carbon monoxide dehydrogenase small subunit (CoxS/CutS family)
MPTIFVLNGQSATLDADPTMPLLWALREIAGLHGTKFGCGMALCGACTVHLDGQAVRSCVLPLSAVAGRQVTTIEGLQSKQGQGRAGCLGRTPSASMWILSVWPNHVGHGTSRKEFHAHGCRYR